MKKIGIIVGAVVLLAGIGGGAYWFLLGGSAKFAGEAKEPTAVHVEGRLGPHIVLKERVFNLATGPGGSKHYLKLGTSIEFETTDPEWYELKGEPLTKALEEFDKDDIGSGRTIIEDLITTIVSGKRVEDISSAEGKDKLREEIRDAISHHVAEPLVHRVLFTSFITD